MNENFAISRIANYKFSAVGGVLKEALRTLPNYDNPDCDASKSYLNVALVQVDLNGLTPEKYLLRFREENNIKGRFNTSSANPKNMTNCMFQVLYTASPEYMAAMSREEQIQFFKDCLEFYKSEFESAFIWSAVIHFDESNPHLHITGIPTVQRLNKKTGEMETIFSTTKLMPGKDFFPKYQDRFYKFISSKYDGFTRSHSERKNMDVKTYKRFRDMEKSLFLAEQKLKEYNSVVFNQKQRINDLYGELQVIRNERSALEDVPLLGFFVKLLLEMKIEEQERFMKQMIKLAEQELEEIKHAPLDEVIAEAESVKKLTPSQKRIIDRLFGSR